MDRSEVRVLIVEDDDGVRLSLRDYLTQRGYEVLVASEGLGAIKQILDYTIDLIVTDYRMDVLGGAYWMKFLRRFCPDIPVLVTSGFLRPELVQPFTVMLKPFGYEELEDEITKLLAVAEPS